VVARSTRQEIRLAANGPPWVCWRLGAGPGRIGHRSRARETSALAGPGNRSSGDHRHDRRRRRHDPVGSRRVGRAPRDRRCAAHHRYRPSRRDLRRRAVHRSTRRGDAVPPMHGRNPPRWTREVGDRPGRRAGDDRARGPPHGSRPFVRRVGCLCCRTRARGTWTDPRVLPHRPCRHARSRTVAHADRMADLPDHTVTRAPTGRDPPQRTSRTNRHRDESAEPRAHLGDELGRGLVGCEMTAPGRSAVVA
jgi:hypothetical protein